MATAKKPARAAAKPIAPAPSPARRAALAGPTSADAPAVGIDPRTVDGAAHEDSQDIPGAGYVDQQGGLHAAPPTPTRESAATANDEPGAGSSTGDAPPVSRHQLMRTGDLVKVHVAKAFTLTDGLGEHRYEVGVNEMPAEHVDHWYAKAHGVTKK